MDFINTYASLPARFYEPVQPAAVPDPTLIAWNSDLANHLGLSEHDQDPDQLTRWFSGNEPLPGGKTIALAYAGHQFGHFAPRLGDGRAALLGEVRSPIDGRGYDLQLKGSGPTAFSRRGDGKSSLGPVIREFLLSEAMHRLGVPTTRALAVIGTGEAVFRGDMEPGGVLTRVASSHIRVGTFQYFAARGDRESLEKLTQYAMHRHYPDVAQAEHPVSGFFAEVVNAQARLVAYWMSLGFIHGVMNTDNMAICGQTLDYGPCAFLDEFHMDKVFSSIDRQGRYAYGNQAHMAQWNLARLAECLLMLDKNTERYEQALEQFRPVYEDHYFKLMRDRLGLTQSLPEDPEFIAAWLRYLQEERRDYTLSFLQLRDTLDDSPTPRFGEFGERWKRRVERQPGGIGQARESMARSNPIYIPRNHQVERAIQAAFQGDLRVFEDLHHVLSDPYREQPGREDYKAAPREEERVEMTFCGT